MRLCLPPGAINILIIEPPFIRQNVGSGIFYLIDGDNLSDRHDFSVHIRARRWSIYDEIPLHDSIIIKIESWSEQLLKYLKSVQLNNTSIVDEPLMVPPITYTNVEGDSWYFCRTIHRRDGRNKPTLRL